MSRNRRAAARVSPLAAATSLSVSDALPSNARITASPRSSDWTKSLPRVCPQLLVRIAPDGGARPRASGAVHATPARRRSRRPSPAAAAEPSSGSPRRSSASPADPRSPPRRRGPRASWIGAATARSPSSSSWSTSAQPCRRTFSSSARSRSRSVIVRAVSAGSSARSRYRSSHSSLCAASRTRPSDVAKAGSSDPTVTDHREHALGRDVRDVDDPLAVEHRHGRRLAHARRRARAGAAARASGSVSPERYARPSSSTRGLSRNARPSART